MNIKCTHLFEVARTTLCGRIKKLKAGHILWLASDVVAADEPNNFISSAQVVECSRNVMR